MSPPTKGGFLRQSGTGNKTATGSGVIVSLNIGSAAATAVVTLRDGSSTGTILFQYTAGAGNVASPSFYFGNLPFSSGVFLDVATAAADATVVFA
jgi:hypothetical protein